MSEVGMDSPKYASVVVRHFVVGVGTQVEEAMKEWRAGKEFIGEKEEKKERERLERKIRKDQTPAEAKGEEEAEKEEEDESEEEEVDEDEDEDEEEEDEEDEKEKDDGLPVRVAGATVRLKGEPSLPAPPRAFFMCA